MFAGWKQLSSVERAVIFSEHRRGSSQREIARLLGRSPSTVSRELARGRPGKGAERPYCPQRGQAVRDRNRLRCRPQRKLVRGEPLWRVVTDHLLKLRWSAPQDPRMENPRRSPQRRNRRLHHKRCSWTLKPPQVRRRS